MLVTVLVTKCTHLRMQLNSECAGAGASPEGNKPFLDVLDLETKQTQRLWQSSPPFLEDTGSLLTDQHDQPITYALPLPSIESKEQTIPFGVHIAVTYQAAQNCLIYCPKTPAVCLVHAVHFPDCLHVPCIAGLLLRQT